MAMPKIKDRAENRILLAVKDGTIGRGYAVGARKLERAMRLHEGVEEKKGLPVGSFTFQEVGLPAEEGEEDDLAYKKR